MGLTSAVQRNAELIARFRRGEAVRTLALDYGISHQRVRQIVVRATPSWWDRQSPARRIALLQKWLVGIKQAARDTTKAPWWREREAATAAEIHAEIQAIRSAYGVE